MNAPRTEIPENSIAMRVWRQTEDMLALMEERDALRAENARLREALTTIEGHVSALATRMISGGDFIKTGTCLLKDVCEPARAALK